MLFNTYASILYIWMLSYTDCCDYGIEHLEPMNARKSLDSLSYNQFLTRPLLHVFS